MITIDKLCYNSKLRYENAGEKFAFAVITLLYLCNESFHCSGKYHPFSSTGILTVWKGGVPFFAICIIFTVPLAFLLLSTLAIFLHIQEVPLDLFAVPLGNMVSDHQLPFSRLCPAADPDSTGQLYPACIFFPLQLLCRISWNVFRKAALSVKLLIELMLLIYRFIFVLLDTAYYISTSQNSRLGNRDYQNKLKFLRCSWFCFDDPGGQALQCPLQRHGSPLL